MEQQEKLSQKTLKPKGFNLFAEISKLKEGESLLITETVHVKKRNVVSNIGYYNNNKKSKYKGFNFSTSEVGLVGKILVTRNKVL